ncbi:MAG TPA: hypothetical protein VII84_01780, partial [Acidimicrobiales bacterium]
LCDEGGSVIFRNTQAETLMANRYGDAIAAQAVTDVLAEGWTNGVAESGEALGNRTMTTTAVD